MRGAEAFLSPIIQAVLRRYLRKCVEQKCIHFNKMAVKAEGIYASAWSRRNSSMLSSSPYGKVFTQVRGAEAYLYARCKNRLKKVFTQVRGAEVSSSKV